MPYSMHAVEYPPEACFVGRNTISVSAVRAAVTSFIEYALEPTEEMMIVSCEEVATEQRFGPSVTIVIVFRVHADDEESTRMKALFERFEQSLFRQTGVEPEPGWQERSLIGAHVTT